MTSCQAFYCTNEKKKCEKILFVCNYRSGLPKLTHRPVTMKNTGKYDFGDKKEKNMCTHQTSSN